MTKLKNRKINTFKLQECGINLPPEIARRLHDTVRGSPITIALRQRFLEVQNTEGCTLAHQWYNDYNLVMMDVPQFYRKFKGEINISLEDLQMRCLSFSPNFNPAIVSAIRESNLNKVIALL